MHDPNLLDNACCKNVTECAKRTRSHPVNKKKPVDPAIIRGIIDRHGTEEASFKDLRIAVIRSLGFARFFFFRFNELAIIFSQNTLPFSMVLLKYLCQGVKRK